MKQSVILTITSLLSILSFSFHWADDIVRGIAPGGVSGLGGVLVLVVWLYGTLVLAERRSGYIIMLLGSIGGLGVLVIHMRGAGLVGGRIANSSGVFFLGLDAPRARRDRGLLRHPFRTRTVEPAMAPATVVPTEALQARPRLLRLCF